MCCGIFILEPRVPAGRLGTITPSLQPFRGVAGWDSTGSCPVALGVLASVGFSHGGTGGHGQHPRSSVPAPTRLHTGAQKCLLAFMGLLLGPVTKTWGGVHSLGAGAGSDSGLFPQRGWTPQMRLCAGRPLAEPAVLGVGRFLWVTQHKALGSVRPYPARSIPCSCRCPLCHGPLFLPSAPRPLPALTGPRLASHCLLSPTSCAVQGTPTSGIPRGVQRAVHPGTSEQQEVGAQGRGRALKLSFAWE